MACTDEQALDRKGGRTVGGSHHPPVEVEPDRVLHQFRVGHQDLGLAGVTLRGINLSSFDDWMAQAVRQGDQTLGLSTMFVPLFRVERIFLDESVGEVESYRQRFAKRGDQIRAEREAREQAERDRLAAEAERKRQAKNAESEALLKKRFLTAGGSEQEWESEKATILSEHRRAQMSEAERRDAEARRSQPLYQRF